MTLRTSTLRSLARASLAVICAFALLPARGHAVPPLYTVTVLNIFEGGASAANDINASGQIAGWAYATDGNRYSVRWTGTTAAVLGRLDGYGGHDDIGVGINDSGQVTGATYFPLPLYNSRAVRWTGTTPTLLDHFGDPAIDAYGNSINESGQVAGVSYIVYGGRWHAVRWTGTTPTDLGTAPPEFGNLSPPYSEGKAINGSGQVVGYFLTATDDPSGNRSRAVRWTGTTATLLGTFGGTRSVATDINDSGQVTGVSSSAGDQTFHAVRWTGTTPTDLGSLGGTNSWGYGINTAGDVVGISYTAGNAAFRSFLYTDGTMYDLNSLLLPGSDIVQLIATAINDLGQIAATGFIGGVRCALRLTPNQPSQITFQRLTNVAHVANPSSGVDVPIQPVSNSTVLDALPAFAGGLVADGVTPWVIKLNGGFPAGNYTLSFEVADGIISNGTIEGTLANRVQVLGGGGWSQGTVVTFTGSDTNAYTYIKGIPAEDIVFFGSKTELTVTVALKDSAAGVMATAAFKIRKPPMVLVHGYNTIGTWGTVFKATLAHDRDPDFVKEIQYGVVDGANTDGNTYSTLARAAFLLSTELKDAEVENPNSALRAGWAFTRYDAVGHSQGGVLLRMLSSARQNGGIPAFRNKSNFDRGRFRRAISIGSPHNGIPLMHYLYKLKEQGNGVMALLGFFEPGLLQKKFDPWEYQIQDLNYPADGDIPAGGRWEPDEDAKFFMIRCTIDGGQSPGPNSPRAFKLNGLSRHGGSLVLPHGSDGAVDLDSQGYSGGSGNVYTVPPSINISHSGGAAGDFLFGTSDNEPESFAVASKVREALNGELGPGESFGPFTVPPPPKSTFIDTNAYRDAIDQEVANYHSTSDATIEEYFGIPPNIAAQRAASISGKIAASNDYQFQLAPSVGQPVHGTVEWLAQSFGIYGVTEYGVSVTVDPMDSKIVTVSVDPDIVGDVILYATHGLENGGAAHVTPIKVVSIPPPGTTLEAIELEGDGSLPEGTLIDLRLWAYYSDGSWLQVYLDPETVAFTSEDETTAEVSPRGEVKLKQQGIATIEVSYHGLTAQTQFTVTPGTVPVVLPPSGVVAVQGVPFQHLITATNLPDNYGAIALPPGLEMNMTTGLISGTPTEAGQFTVSVDAANAIGIGTGSLKLTVWTKHQNWRSIHFGSPDNSGDGADLNDYDHDGILNLAEFAFGLNPKQSSSGQLPGWQSVGNDFVTSFIQPAGVSGITYGAEWSTTLLPGSWAAIPDTGTPPEHIFAVPIDLNTPMFMRLRVTSP